jgi:hypothetical protein
MEKGWPFRKIKHDAKTGFSGAKKKKTLRNHRYESVEHAHRLFEENQPVLGGMRACRAVAGTSTTPVSRCLRCRMRNANDATRSAAVVSSSHQIYAMNRPSSSTPTTGPPS